MLLGVLKWKCRIIVYDLPQFFDRVLFLHERGFLKHLKIFNLKGSVLHNLPNVYLLIRFFHLLILPSYPLQVASVQREKLVLDLIEILVKLLEFLGDYRI